MTSIVNRAGQGSDRIAADRSRSFQPGGWGDRLVFGYMFRIITGLVAVVLPIVILVVWGAINGWQVTSAMVWFFGISVGAIVVAGETLRIGVYESRLATAQHPDKIIDEVQSITRIEEIDDGSWTYRTIKRASDIVLSATLILLVAPIYILVPFLIKFDSPGPAVYRTPRVGYRGRQYKQYRFRITAVTLEADRGREAQLTRVGQFLTYSSLDELPMLFNVLLGDMTFVGPRSLPTRNAVGPAEAADRYSEALRFLHHERPGLTGPDRLSRRRGAIEGYWQYRSIVRDFSVIIGSIVKVLRGF